MSENNSLQNNGKPIQSYPNMEILNAQTPSNKIDIFKIDQHSSIYGKNDFHLHAKGLVIPKPNITLDKLVVNSNQDTTKVNKEIRESANDNKKQKLDKRVDNFTTKDILTNHEIIDRVLPFPPNRKRNLLERFVFKKGIEVRKNEYLFDHKEEFESKSTESNSTDTSKVSSWKSKDTLQKYNTKTKKEDEDMLKQEIYSIDNTQKLKTSLVSSTFQDKDISPLLKLAKAKLAAFPDISMLVIRPTETLHSGDLTSKDKNKSEKIIYEDIFPRRILSATIKT